MQQYNCIIIEDEPLAAEILEDYVADVPFLKLIKSYPDALRALESLRDNHIDLIFLDINLPRLKGLDFIRTLKEPPHIILTTAYHEYALEGYELNIVDYLLKPIEFSRFLKAVNKLKAMTSEMQAGQPAAISTSRDHMFINTNKMRVKVFFDEILYIESLKEYVKIVTPDKSLITRFQLGMIEEQLPKEDFLRIHRSFIVSKAKIDAYSSSIIETGGRQIPIGRNYKELTINSLENNG
ncbi:response regulator [Pedobacter sp. HMF7647]|uniref:Response regulator n=1 Tax=Hufsiella arboris TaxID=2695275 RepID=A0A7K1Y7G6_9SPHI|nr:LytTR family DNA-binding domain-containing protein [Hufsiella arboris]MXV50507.1 response regulator [Hufsiella arboris]